MSVTRKQYPAQTGAYKIRVKNKSPGFPDDNRLLRLEISVGQNYHEGDKFECTIDWAKHRYDKVIVLVNDTLQRFNHMLDKNLSEKEAYNLALSEGSDWLKRNLPVIAHLPNYEVYRWDAWRRDNDYFSALKKCRQLYKDYKPFKQAIDDAVNEVWDRRNLDTAGKDDFYKLSTDYLIEETAAFSIIYKTFPGVSAYPGSFQDMWEMFLTGSHPGAPDGLENAHCMRIDFSRRH